MGHQVATRTIVSIFVLLWITLFSVSSEAANCHESSQKKIESNFTKQTVLYALSSKDFFNTSKCCDKNALGACCELCNACKISSGTPFVNEYTENKRDKYQGNKVSDKNNIIEASTRDLVHLKLPRIRHINTNISPSNTPLKFRYRILQV